MTKIVSGQCDHRFARVKEEFQANFRSRGEVGAAVCVYLQDRCVVDLWGGYREVATRVEWRENTIVCMMSVGKSMPALCVLMLVDRNLIDLDEPVAAYWPEFAQNGKAAITVRQMLGGHAGLIFTDAATPGALYRWEEMISAIEQQPSEWTPGTRGAYHSSTYGFMVGELVRRVDGRRFEEFFAEEIAKPLGISYKFGLTNSDLTLVADLIENPENATMTLMQDSNSNLGRAWKSAPEGPAFYFNQHEFRTVVIPSSNGHGNARAAARVYAALANGGEIDTVRLLSPDLIEQARTVQWDGNCGLTGRDYKYGLGFFLNKAPLTDLGPNPRTFGHPGAGGANAFADPENGIAFGYCPNALYEGEDLGERCQSLIRAVYRSIE